MTTFQRSLALVLGVLMLPVFAPGPAEAGLFDIFKPQQVAPPADDDAEPSPPASVGDDNDAQPGAQPGMQPAPMAPSAVPSARAGSAASDAQAALRMDRMEQQMRQMTGQIEELTFQLNQLQAQIRALQSGGGRSAKVAADTAPQLRPGTAASAPPGVSGADPIGTAIGMAGGATAGAAPAGSASGAPPRNLGQLPAAANGQPLDLSTMAAAPSAAGAPVTPDAPSGDARSDYDAAYDHVLKGDYMVAQSSFQIFLANYPGDALAPDAQYWIGESLYQRGDYRSAADAFLTGYQKYPKSGKAPDMLLKLGLSLAGLGQREAACGTYAEIFKKYPKASNALLQRVKTEQASASC